MLVCKNPLEHAPQIMKHTGNMSLVCIICYTPVLPISDRLHIHGSCRCNNGRWKHLEHKEAEMRTDGRRNL